MSDFIIRIEIASLPFKALRNVWIAWGELNGQITLGPVCAETEVDALHELARRLEGNKNAPF